MMGQQLYKLGERLMKKEIVLDGNGDFAIPMGKIPSGEQTFKFFPCSEVDDLKAAIRELAEARAEFDSASAQWENFQ